MRHRYRGIPGTCYSTKEAAFGKIDVNDLLIQLDAAECLFFPIPDIQIEGISRI